MRLEAPGSENEPHSPSKLTFTRRKTMKRMRQTTFAVALMMLIASTTLAGNIGARSEVSLAGNIGARTDAISISTTLKGNIGAFIGGLISGVIIP
jgi:hypothetical protein